MAKDMVTLWRLTWSHAQGVHWLGMRLCEPANAEAWAEIFRKDDAQGTIYVVSKKRPPLPDNARALARHVAVFH